MLKYKLRYRLAKTLPYPFFIAGGAFVSSALLLNGSGTNFWTLTFTSMALLLAISVFISLSNQQKRQPDTISVNSGGVLTLNDGNTRFHISSDSRCTPWFIMLALTPHSGSIARRLILWSKGMQLSDYRTLARLVNDSCRQLKDKKET